MAKYTEPYQPEVIEVPPLFQWPLKPKAIARWLTIDLMAPWGLFWIGLACLFWFFLTPSFETMQTFSIGWVAFLWIRNAITLFVVAGSLHWWFYIRKAQNEDTKFVERSLATNDRRFLWKDQVLDNMTFSLVSGVSFWTLYEAVTYWLYANDYVGNAYLATHPVYFTVMLWLVFFWSTFHFYLNHRLLHWKPLYDLAHERHHRNSVTGPWSGISMHPIEHIIYFMVFCLWWVVPVHPIIIILTGLFQGVSPAVSHSGYDYLLPTGRLAGKFKLTTGDNFHNLHHRLFRVNYGNSIMPVDRVFGTWHGGSEEDRNRLRKRGTRT